MVTLEKFSQTGEKIGQIEVDERLAQAEAHGQSVKDYLVALRHNKRQWSACTKTRAEVKHTTAKAYRQKGTGNARHGSLVAPQYRGGGIVFGPRPKFSVNIRMNKKERRQAIRALLGEKIRQGKLAVIESLQMEAPKTKAVASFIEKATQKRRLLFVGESQQETVETEGRAQTLTVQQNNHRNFAKSLRNIPKTHFSLASTVNGYDLVLADEIFVTEQALQEITAWLCSKGGKVK